MATGLGIPYLSGHPGLPWVAVHNGTENVRCYDFGTGELIADYKFPGPVHAFAWQPCGKLIAVTGWDSSLHLWDGERECDVRSMGGHQRIIIKISFNPTGKLVATQSYDGTSRLWNTASGREMGRLPGGPAVFDRSGSRLAVVTSQFGQFTFDLWDCSESSEFTIMSIANQGELTPRSIALTPNGARVIAAGDDGIRVLDIDEGSEQQYVPLLDAHSVTCPPDGKQVFVNSGHGLFRFSLKDSQDKPLSDRTPLVSKESTELLRELAQSDNGARLAAVVGRGRATLIDLANGNQRNLDFHQKWCGLAIRGDGNLVAGFLPRHVGIWRFDTGERVAQIALQGDGYSRLTFSPDGEHLIVGDPLNFRCYEGETWSLQFTRPRGAGALFGVSAFSPDGKLLAIAHSRKTAQLIDPRTGNELCTLFAPEPYPDIAAIRFTPDGSRLLVAGTNRLIQIWDIAALRRQLTELGLDWSNSR